MHEDGISCSYCYRPIIINKTPIPTTIHQFKDSLNKASPFDLIGALDRS